MKSALVYLTAIKLKNQLKSVLKSPAKLVYGILLIALLVFTATVKNDVTSATGYRGVEELTAILTLFYTMMFLMVFASGSSGNTSMFTMSDVTLLFPAPLRPTRVLFYGLLRQLTMSLLLGFFLLFQYSWLNRLYGVTYYHLILIIVGYAIILFFAQLCSMTVYLKCSGNPAAKSWVKRGVYGAATLYVLCAFAACREQVFSFQGQNFDPLLTALTGFFSTLPGLLFPASGWAAGFTGGLLSGDYGISLLFAALLLLLGGVLVLVIVRSKDNYYEDAMQTAETSHSAITAQKEGRYGEVVPQKVRVGKIGLQQGDGASALYYKHKVENRRSGIFLISNMSLIFMVITLVMCFFLRELGIAFVLGFATYMQMFSVALGRFSRELSKPYLYLIPEPPLKKLLYALKESLITEVAESIVLFVLAGLILQASPLDILACIIARISFSFLFTAGNVVVERVFGTVSSKALIFLFYFLVLIIMAIPGGALAILISVLLPAAPLLVILTVFAVGNVAVSLLALYLCRNMLQYAELNGR